jgi:hypothetical protein
MRVTNNDVVVSFCRNGMFDGRRLGLCVVDTTGAVVGTFVGLGVNIGDVTGILVKVRVGT